MTRWTKWIKLDNTKISEIFDHDGACYYQLGVKVKHRRMRSTSPVYVGHAGNEEIRILQHASGKSHLKNHIDYIRRRGFLLCYRAVALKRKKQAEEMEKRLLEKRYYP